MESNQSTQRSSDSPGTIPAICELSAVQNRGIFGREMFSLWSGHSVWVSYELTARFFIFGANGQQEFPEGKVIVWTPNPEHQQSSERQPLGMVSAIDQESVEKFYCEVSRR